jgi:hypothetical protein
MRRHIAQIVSAVLAKICINVMADRATIRASIIVDVLLIGGFD